MELTKEDIEQVLAVVRKYNELKRKKKKNPKTFGEGGSSSSEPDPSSYANTTEVSAMSGVTGGTTSPIFGT